jgi:F0F1-type ATP synthase assembly protein I
MPADPDRGLSGTGLIGLGIYLAGVVVVPLIAGLLLDRLTHTSPLFLLLGLLVGVSGAGAGLWAQMKRYM